MTEAILCLQGQPEKRNWEPTGEAQCAQSTKPTTEFTFPEQLLCVQKHQQQLLEPSRDTCTGLSTSPEHRETPEHSKAPEHNPLPYSSTTKMVLQAPQNHPQQLSPPKAVGPRSFKWGGKISRECPSRSCHWKQATALPSGKSLRAASTQEIL